MPIGDDGPPVLDPHTPFAAHTTPGTPLTIRTDAGDLPEAAFRPDDPDLTGYVVLDWDSFAQWFEEDEPVPRSPARPVRPDRLPQVQPHTSLIASDGVTLADTTRATLLFETPLPTRYYVPREDVAMDLLDRT